MKRTFHFGKIDYRGTGRKDCAVSVMVELKEDKDRLVFSAHGEIWNPRHTDIYCGGQCLDTIAKYVKIPLFNEIFTFWKKYHLNDMHPECKHQAELGWIEQARRRVDIYYFKLTADGIKAHRNISARVMDAAKRGETVQTTKDEQKILALDYSVKYHANVLPADIAPFYQLDKTESKLCGWLYETEHPNGILDKTCPVCGYKYGSGWNFVAIPADDINRIKELIETGA